MLAGATAVSIGTGNFIEPEVSIKAIEGIEDYRTSRRINDEIQIQNIAIGFPNNYKENSSVYMDTLAKNIQQKFGESVKVLINTEAAYAGTLLLNLNILSDGEMGMIVDVGAGTTDIALVKAGRNSKVVAEASVDFGGRIVDDIIKYGTDRRRNLLCSVGNKSAEAMIQIKEWLFEDNSVQPPSFSINNGDSREEFCKTKIYKDIDYCGGLNELEDEIKNKIGKQINIPDGSQFKVVLTGGSCRLPKVKDVVDKALNEVFSNRTITIQYIYLDEYCAEEEGDRDIDNETFMSYAAALVAESRRESERINSDMPQTASRILVPQTGAFGIIALKAYIGRRSDINDSREWLFIKLTTIDSCYAGEVSKKIAGKFYRINGEGFVGIANDIYLLEEVGNLNGPSCVEGHSEKPVNYIDENGELQQERGKIYKLHDAVRYIKVAFTPTYVDNSGTALVKDVNGNNITNISEAYNDTVEQTSGTYTYTYNLELTYNYDMKAGYDEKMQVLYQQNKERPTN